MVHHTVHLGVGHKIILETKGLSRSFHAHGEVVEPFHSLNLKVYAGEFIALTGRSGSGKSTLLHCLGLLDHWQAGEIMIMGERTRHLNENARSMMRQKGLGFVYQRPWLLTDLSVLENVTLPLRILGWEKANAEKEARFLLKELGLSHRVTAMPSTLSGGEQQRVSIARAIIHRPALILADEPTGNLDKKNAQNVFLLLRKLSQERGCTLIVATHEPLIAEQADRIIKLS